MAYDKTNKGILSRNQRKEKDTHPDFNGSCVIAAPGEYWISAWVKETDGRKWFSLAFKPKDGGETKTVNVRSEPASLRDELLDDIPF